MRRVNELLIVNVKVPWRHEERARVWRAMTQERLEHWFNALGFDPASAALHRPRATLTPRHPYAPELHDLLNPDGEIRAEAVFDVEGVPTVAFFLGDGLPLQNGERLDALRQRIWNQGLVSVLLVVRDDGIVPVPVVPKAAPGDVLPLEQARRDGPLSKADIQSGEIRERHPDWFELEERVDRKLLSNLRATISELTRAGGADMRRDDAQHLVAQMLFVSYLEHRGIVGPRYRDERKVGSLHDLVSRRDRKALVELFDRLKHDFNGDFLDDEQAVTSLWARIPDAAFEAADQFLAATDIERRQPALFPYNFRYIPVELLSGVYETFLGVDDKKEHAAYYTPRHLANLAVDQAFEGVGDLLAQKIYDGACGSGILLTTAFRRLIGEAEARSAAGTLELRSRIKLLRGHIFGSDLNEAACRVTAFSLYLSLLERLQPSDIVALCDDHELKLPTLRGRNLVSGADGGDFFSPENALAREGGYTLLLSNPPWMEVTAGSGTWVDRWAKQTAHPRTLKQIAADFAWRASQIAAPGARICLILPMSLLLKPTSQSFLAGWLQRVRPQRIINFGDLKELLFPEARMACVVFVGERREPVAEDGAGVIPGDERFDYWAPKADVSLAFGRLTLHGSDRHRVQTWSVARSNRELVTRMWGDGYDLALWAKLSLRGTLRQMFDGRQARWTKRKGLHRTDRSGEPMSSSPFRNLPFVRPAMLYDAPVFDTRDADDFPVDEIPTFVGKVEELLPVFSGPRIVFPDGPAPDGTIRAAYLDGPGAFMSSVGVIAGPSADEDLLRFTAVYLRSDLARYFTMMQLYQLLSDRDRISLQDVAGFPFYPPERHPEPQQAREIVAKVATASRRIEKEHPLKRRDLWEQLKPDLDREVEAYFGLADEAGAIVRESVEVLRPLVRPYGMSAVYEHAGVRTNDKAVERYARALRAELEARRDAVGGEGRFDVRVQLTNIERAGAFGIVRVTAGEVRSRVDTERSDQAVQATVQRLAQAGLLQVSLREHLYVAADTIIVEGNSVYLIKPQTERLWLQRQARRDAERIVEATTAPETTQREIA